MARATVALLLLGLIGCASQPRVVSVSLGEMFPGNYINIRAPSTDGWELMQSSNTDFAFAKGNRAASESYIAHVAMFNLSPTNTPEEFEALIKAAAEKDTDPARFDMQQQSFKFSNERSYPCVRYRSVATDKAPQAPTSPLILEMDAIYCRHPARPETGFAAIYSHRGQSSHPNLRNEAESFIQGVQVPSK